MVETGNVDFDMVVEATFGIDFDIVVNDFCLNLNLTWIVTPSDYGILFFLDF